MGSIPVGSTFRIMKTGMAFRNIIPGRFGIHKFHKLRRSGGMADAQASGACYGNIVWVQVPSPASSFLEAHAEVSELADEQD